MMPSSNQGSCLQKQNKTKQIQTQNKKRKKKRKTREKSAFLSLHHIMLCPDAGGDMNFALPVGSLEKSIPLLIVFLDLVRRKKNHTKKV